MLNERKKFVNKYHNKLEKLKNPYLKMHENG